MYKLNIEHDAQQDLKSMVANGMDEKQYAMNIAALLSEMKADQGLLGSLLDHNFENVIFNVSKFQAFWRDRDVWRLKLFEWDFTQKIKYTIPYRVIYAYDFKCLTFRILAVVHRDFNYENDHPITKRILNAYSELGLQISKSYSSGKYKH